MAGSGAAQAVFDDAALVLLIAQRLCKKATPRKLAFASCATRSLRAALASAPCLTILRRRCARRNPALVRLVDADNGNGSLLRLLRRLSSRVKLEVPPPPRWTLANFEWAIDVSLRGEHILSYNYVDFGSTFKHKATIAPNVDLRARDLNPVNDDDTAFTADMYVRRFDGAIATVVKNAAGVEEDSYYDESGKACLRLCFWAKSYVVYTRALWRADEPSTRHCILPECEFHLVFAACDDKATPLRNQRRQKAEELNRPVRIDADDALLSSPLLQILHAYDSSFLEMYLNDDDTLTFLTALSWA
jgi:hypothetical protein